ncbi:MAG: ParB/RepB/Spo0J family partition protein [Syntrophales bacterium]|nr:ParB/RepB/Spo0J family partition protein [Syntrophales bacterium]MDD5641249.1 ParB/RepB/Spo0J family partition protein [Syntrophales bacterium]
MAKKPTGDCATCSFWRRKASPVKGKLIPGGTGKCTRKEGLCDNPKPKDPIPEQKGKPKKERGLRPQAPETNPQSDPRGSNEVPLSLIYPNPGQPRKVFPKAALEELALSIKEQGLIEPLVVVAKGEKFMLIAGERRWRACQMAGLESAPVRILEVDDRQVAEMALVENIQRQDLTPLEEARAFKEMLDKNGYTKEELAQKLGFKQVWRVDERLSLLNLAPKFQDALTFGVITPSQAFEISRLSGAEDQEVVFRKIKAGELPTYNHLRRFVNAMVDSKKDKVLFAMPKKQDMEVVSRWEKTLDAVTGLIVKSFSPEDCKVLARVCQGNAQVNLIKIDMIIKHLNLVKKAMLENASRQEVYGLINGGANLVPVESLSPA